ncbi:hypothetical protein MRS44_009657 [Fusarium solani]|uniref:uncharacterized protein n=1 Tax=Fusarium solani TaxID=169388 RepID=UPI0032C41447|nr:hypothetical protein MRS44_009657 [Fusarium solani]
MSQKKHDVPKDLAKLISEQVVQDPRLPRPQPTVSKWQVPPHPDVSSLRSAQLPETVDFAVIGSGITACGAVKQLLNEDAAVGKTVTVFEARELCSSATGRNGGQLTRIPPVRHLQISKQIGVEQANKVVRFNLKCLRDVHALAEPQGMDVETDSRHVRLNKLFIYYDQGLYDLAVAALKFYEAHIPEERGVFQVVSKDDLSTLHLKGAVGAFRFPAGVVSPYRLVTNTFKNLLATNSDRFTIETRTPVTAVRYDPRGNAQYPYIISTPRGSVCAGQVLHCTNGYTGHLNAGLRGPMYPYRGAMSAQTVESGFPNLGREFSWSYFHKPHYDEKARVLEKGHYYAGQHPSTGDMWIGCHKDGIEGFVTSDDTEIGREAEKALEAALPKLYDTTWVPETKKRDMQIWSGVMCLTGDGLPFVGRLPRSATLRDGNGEWLAGGYNQWGMVNGLLCGSTLAQMVVGKDVSEWLPEAYVLNAERLRGKPFTREAIVKGYFARIGFFNEDSVSIEEPISSKL